MTFVLPTDLDGTETQHNELGDLDLISRVRAGDDTAFAELYGRHYRAAYAVACARAGACRADDLVADAFLAVFKMLRRGHGPDHSFKSYLLATVRTMHLGSLRSTRRELLVDDYNTIATSGLITDGVDQRLDGASVVRALGSLPDRWQTVLWLTIVEERSHDEVGELMQIRPNAVAALAFRAREGLRRAYLADHVQPPADVECSVPIADVPAYLRGTLGENRRKIVERHLESCSSCEPVIHELGEINRSLSAVS
jgi:RNA polymerase sigma factor (sigma-70 family)